MSKVRESVHNSEKDEFEGIVRRVNLKESAHWIIVRHKIYISISTNIGMKYVMDHKM